MKDRRFMHYESDMAVVRAMLKAGVITHTQESS